MNFNSKKILLSLLLYTAGSFAEANQTFGIYGLLFRNKVRATMSLLNDQHTFYNNNTVECFDNDQDEASREASLKLFKETIEKIDQLAYKIDIERKNQKKSKISSHTVECLETINNPYFLQSVKNKSALMHEILNCMNAAEKEAQE